jgi:hypothetical protein
LLVQGYTHRWNSGEHGRVYSRLDRKDEQLTLPKIPPISPATPPTSEVSLRMIRSDFKTRGVRFQAASCAG